MNTLYDVKAKVRALVGDPMGDFCTDAYLTPLINQVYADQFMQLQSETGSSFEEEVRDVPALPLGTTSMENYQAESMANEDGTKSTGPLYGLITPIVVEWKVSGQPDAWYVEAARTGKLPNVSPAAPYPPYLMQWEWRGGVIYLTPLQYPCDVRVRAEYAFTPLVKDTDRLRIHPNMATATAYGAAALVGAERNNANYATQYAEQAQRTLEQIANILVRAEQGTTTRLGRLNNRTGCGANGAGGWRG